MVNVKLISIGSLKESYLREAFSEYAKRLGGLCHFESIELKETKLPDNPSESEIFTALEDEAKKILAHVSPRAYTIALCIEGKQYSSEEFAEIIDKATLTSAEICLVIGSSHGLSDTIKKAANLRLSFSKMTFPHQLARIICAEVLYRSFNIIKGTKYHK